MLRWREFASRPGECPFCGPTVLLRLRREETGVRCARCAASAVHLSIGWALCTQVAELGARDAYELSSRGPLVAHLVRHARSLLLSEYFDGIAPGSVHHGRSEEHTSELQSLMRISYAVFCLKKKNTTRQNT